MKTYCYALTELAAVPKGYLRWDSRPRAGQPLHDVAVNGFLIYDRRLNSDETSNCRMALVLDEDGELEALKKFIDLAWALYPNGLNHLLAFAARAPDWFCQQIGRQFKQLYPGYPPVVRDLPAFTERVLNALREEQS